MATGKQTIRRVFPALACSAFFLLMAILWCGGHLSGYQRIIKIWGVHPFPFPFVDTDTVLSAVRCLNRGIDVYVVNPCDALGRVYDYSPLWMVLTVFPMTTAWVLPIGLGVDIAFLFSLLLLPAGRSWRDTLLIASGVISGATLFAIERGNNDLVLFVLASCAATLVCRSAGLRLIGYSLALLAGLLKYYPMTLMLIATREKPARLFAVAAASTAVTVLFAVLTWHDLTRALALIPTGFYFGDMFGSVTVGGALTQLFGLPPGATKLIRAGMSLVAIGTGVMLALRPDSRRALAMLTERERSFLLVGGLLILSCFFTAQNIGYRAVHLILVLPALTVLYRMSGLLRFRAALPLALGLLWSVTWGHAVRILTGNQDFESGIRFDLVDGAAWALREAMWWWLVTILVSCVVTLLMDSPAATRLLRRSDIG